MDGFMKVGDKPDYSSFVRSDVGTLFWVDYEQMRNKGAKQTQAQDAYAEMAMVHSYSSRAEAQVDITLARYFDSAAEPRLAIRCEVLKQGKERGKPGRKSKEGEV